MLKVEMTRNSVIELIKNSYSMQTFNKKEMEAIIEYILEICNQDYTNLGLIVDEVGFGVSCYNLKYKEQAKSFDTFENAAGVDLFVASNNIGLVVPLSLTILGLTIDEIKGEKDDTN
jgi:hypothetical protein